MTIKQIPFLRLLAYLRPYRKDYTTASFFSVLNKLFDIAPEVLIGVAVDTVVRQENSWLAYFGITNSMNQLIILGVLTFIIWASESLSEYAYSVRWRGLAQTIQHKLRLETYGHVQNLDLAFFENKSTGQLLSILNDDVNQLERFLETGINDIIQVFVSSVVIGLIFFIINPALAGFAILPIPFILIGTFIFQAKLGPRYLDVREKAGLLGGRLANNIAGIFTIKAFTSQNYELNKVAEDSSSYLEANRHAIQLSAAVTPVIRVAVLSGFLITLMYGGYLTINGWLEIGAFSILVFLTQRLLWPLTRLAETSVLFQRAMASTNRVLDLLNQPIHIRQDGEVLQNIKGEVEFQNVSFRYQSSHQILKDVSVTIPAGKTTAFVGSTGSGKSTLIKLLLRFYNPTDGKIILDDKETNEIDLQSLRQNISVVNQDIFLFHGTVAENIAYALPDCSLEAIKKAAELAEASHFIENLPDGYQTLIGERGQKLSGGQKQRLAIARAILRDPKILILDEATSAVDNETELAIQKSLEKIVVGRTTIMIAHRLSTVRHADQIHVLDQGQIVESGTHDELLKQQGIYSSLWNLQTGSPL